MKRKQVRQHLFWTFSCHLQLKRDKFDKLASHNFTKTCVWGPHLSLLGSPLHSKLGPHWVPIWIFWVPVALGSTVLGGKDICNAFRECDSISLEPLCFVLLIATYSLWVLKFGHLVDQADVMFGAAGPICGLLGDQRGEWGWKAPWGSHGGLSALQGSPLPKPVSSWSQWGSQGIACLGFDPSIPP